MKLLALLQHQPVNEAFCKLLSFEDAIELQNALGEEQIIPCTIEAKDGKGHILTFNGVNPTTIRAYNLVKNKDAEQIFRIAAKNNNIEIVELLLGVGINVNNVDDLGYTALIWASQRGQAEIVRILIEHGANVNAVGHNGVSALILASQYGRTETVRILLENGANINIRDKAGTNALMRASANRRAEVIELLKSYGAV